MVRIDELPGIKMSGKLKLPVCAALGFLLVVDPASAAPSFSIDLSSPSVPGVLNSAILGPGPTGGPPTILAPAGSMGLSGGVADEVNALSTGSAAVGTLHFSVSRTTAGVAGSVPVESALGQAAGDVFLSKLDGSNSLGVNQRGLGLIPAIISGIPAAPPIDDIDALSFNFLATPVTFSLAAGHSIIGSGLGCGGDLFFDGDPGGLGLIVPYGALGLVSCADDIDALEISATNVAYFSLTPASPSLAPGSPIIGCAAGCSAADVFQVDLFLGAASLFAPAAALGLDSTDDLNALGWTVVDAAELVPAVDGAGTLLLVGALLGLGRASLRGRAFRG
jgi:hypothetical protein